MLAVKAREPQAPVAEMKGHVCVRVCLELKGQGEKKKIDVTALHLLQNMPDSLWWDRLTPNASPPSHRSHHTRPAPTTFILAHVTSVLGTAEQVFSLPWQPVERARPLAARGEEEKGPQCQRSCA